MLASAGELQVVWASVHVGIEKGKRTQYMGGYVMGRDWICRCVRCVVTGVYWEAALKTLALRNMIQLTTSSRFEESACAFHPVDTLAPSVSV